MRNPRTVTPAENRAIHNAANLAGKAVIVNLQGCYELAALRPADKRPLIFLLEASEHMRAVVEQMAELATGRTKRDIESLAQKILEETQNTVEELVEGGLLPPPDETP